MQFLLKHQRVLFCSAKAYLLRKRLRQRHNLSLQCQKVQRLYRNYRRCQILNFVVDTMRQEKQKMLLMRGSANIIIAFFRMAYHRVLFLSMRNACIICQTFIRKSIIRFRGWSDFKEQGIYHQETQIVALVETCGKTVEETETETAKGYMLNEVNESAIKWRRLVTFHLEQEQKRHSSANLIQNLWRHKIHSIELKKLRLRREKSKELIMSFINQQNALRKIENWAIFVIQKHFRRRVQWNSRMRLLVEESKRQREIFTIMIKLALHLQSYWRMIKAKRAFAIMQSKWLQQTGSAITLQSWWRQYLSRAKYNYKSDILQRWRVLVHGRYWKTKHQSATVIQAGIRAFKQKIAYQRAAKTLVSLLPILFTKRKRKKKLFLLNQTSAAIQIQRLLRGILIRKMIGSQNSASVRIQRIWRLFTCRQLYRNLCVNEQKRIRQVEIREKEQLKERRKIKLIQLLFQGTEERAAIIIQTRYRHHITVIRREGQAQKREDEDKLKRVAEEERRQAIMVYKKQKRNVKNIAKKYLDSAFSVISNIKPKEVLAEVKKNINNYQNDKAEKEIILQELVKFSTLRNHGIKQKSDAVKSFQDSVIETFAIYDWFDRRCEQFMLSYAIFPEELHQLRR